MVSADLAPLSASRDWIGITLVVDRQHPTGAAPSFFLMQDLVLLVLPPALWDTHIRSIERSIV